MMMTRRTRLAVTVLVGVLAGVVAGILDGEGPASGMVLLAAGVVLGEILELRLEDGTGIPLSYAVIVVLASSFGFGEAAMAIAAAELVVASLGLAGGTWKDRLDVLGHRVLVVAAAFGAFAASEAAFGGLDTAAELFVALALTAAAELLADEVGRVARRRRSALSPRGHMAWLALGTSGMLMAVGYRGVDGGSDFGIWGPLLFSIPLLAAWYAFERLDSAARTYRQTIEALSMAPELGGLVLDGHAERVASLAVALGQDLGLDEEELEHLETAAWLHHLGQVTLDEPDPPMCKHDAGHVAAVTAEMLREIAPLAAAGEIVAAESSAYRTPGRPSRQPPRTASQILKVTSAYDDLTDGDPARSALAVEALFSGPGYLYETRALDALDRTVRTSPPRS